jgi:hypothetical protein
MILELALSLLAPASVAPAATAVAPSSDPPIQLWLSSDNSFMRGEHARVYLRAAQDGYVVVLRSDGDGHVRVLFPLDPSDDNFARGDRKFEVRSRGDHDAFTVDEDNGSGLVLAAWSANPFKFDGYVRGDHWDFRTLNSREAGDDAEAGLVAIVQEMAGDAHFDYDVATYTVNAPSAYYHRPYYGPCFGCGYWGGWYGWPYGGVRVSIGFGHPWRWRIGYSSFGPFCDSYWGPWGCGPYDPFFGPSFVYRSYFYRPYVYRPWGYDRFGFGGRDWGRPGFRSTTLAAGIEPRLRIPNGALLSRSSATRVTASQGFVRRGFDRSASVARGWSGERGRSNAPATRSSPAVESRRSSPSSGAPRAASPGYSRGQGGSRSYGGAVREGRGSSGGGRSWGGSGGGGGGGRRGGEAHGGGGGGGGGRRR